nr:unnamed protein product [Spirometra erinaceieuropaei]
MQRRWSGHLVRMDDERLPKRLFYGDVATGSRRARTRSTDLEGTVKTGAAIYEANRIAAVKAKREARKSQHRPVRNATAQPLPPCLRCQRTFRARIPVVGHLRIYCASRTAPNFIPPPASSSSSLPPNNSDNSSDPPLPSSFSFSSYSSLSSSSSSTPSSSSSSSSTTAPLAHHQARHNNRHHPHILRLQR